MAAFEGKVRGREGGREGDRQTDRQTDRQANPACIYIWAGSIPSCIVAG